MKMEMNETNRKNKALLNSPSRGAGGIYSPFQIGRKYLHYYLTAANGKGHGIHSPFVFDFVTHVLNDTRDYPEYSRIELLRRQLLQDRTMLEIEDMGAGSAANATRLAGTGDQRSAVKGNRSDGTGVEEVTLHSIRRRSVADIARHAAKPKKLGQLLFRIARYYRPGTILELGTSLGLSTAYLAAGGEGARVISIEGAPAVAAVAEKNLRALGLMGEGADRNEGLNRGSGSCGVDGSEGLGRSGRVELITGNFDEVLTTTLTGKGSLDLAFVDGNHRREPTLRYFDWLAGRVASSAVLIFDDIHWSSEMEQAWNEIRKDPRVFLTVDLFFLGLVFFRDEFKVKQDFIIRY